MWLQRVVQSVGTTTPGLVLGRAAYRAAAHAAGRALASVPGVVAVYATGSLYSEWLQPGYSDIDLAVVVNVRDLEDELRLRADLKQRLSVLNALGTVFRDLDYLEEQDLPLIRRFHDAWTLDLDRRWIFLAGSRAPIAPAFATPAPSASLPRIALLDAMRRWLKASSFLADPRARREARIEIRGAYRLFCDCLTARLGVDRQYPMRDLVALSLSRNYPARFVHDPGIIRTGHADHRRVVLDLLSSSLSALESLADVVTAAWTPSDGWCLPDREPMHDEAAERVAAEALAVGFAHVALVSRLGGERMLLVVPPDGDAHDHLVRLSELLSRVGPLSGAAFAWAPRPVLVTRALWRAAALMDPVPLVGGALARGEYLAFGGAAPEPPSRPPRDEWTEMLRARALRQFWRARSRSFRVMKHGDALAREVLVVQPELARAMGISEPSVTAAVDRGRLRDEAALLGFHRDWIAFWRRELGAVRMPAGRP
jgi:predicted nucleotidyltransferase